MCGSERGGWEQPKTKTKTKIKEGTASTSQSHPNLKYIDHKKLNHNSIHNNKTPQQQSQLESVAYEFAISHALKSSAGAQAGAGALPTGCGPSFVPSTTAAPVRCVASLCDTLAGTGSQQQARYDAWTPASCDDSCRGSGTWHAWDRSSYCRSS